MRGRSSGGGAITARSAGATLGGAWVLTPLAPPGLHLCCLLQAQLALGTMGIPVLVTVLQDDRDDLELLRGALECLVHAMAGAGNPPPQGPALTPQQQQAALEAQAGAVNAEMFARKPEHVALLLALIEDEPVGARPPVTGVYLKWFFLLWGQEELSWQEKGTYGLAFSQAHVEGQGLRIMVVSLPLQHSQSLTSCCLSRPHRWE